ncbi:putative NTF2-like domain-containing protein [Rosa chinensis]|uniref:Putative NTF2-like domain-containing protein n=1 Tax=Rosa chinensis TaxID=74649 RepID=A0A2P6R0A8_ROSCH|nr:putative NTF2-like domain-containing protein [Rosa chinensis]
MLTFEGEEIQGSQKIAAKLTGLRFQQCWHHISTIDCQPSAGDGMLVFVSGALQLPGEQPPLKFSQVRTLFSFWLLTHSSLIVVLFCLFSVLFCPLDSKILSICIFNFI